MPPWVHDPVLGPVTVPSWVHDPVLGTVIVPYAAAYSSLNRCMLVPADGDDR